MSVNNAAPPYTLLPGSDVGLAAGYDAGVERGAFSASEEAATVLGDRQRRKLKRGRQKKGQRHHPQAPGQRAFGGGGHRHIHDSIFNSIHGLSAAAGAAGAAPGAAGATPGAAGAAGAAAGRVYAACIGKEIRTEEVERTLERTQWVRQRVISEEAETLTQYFRRKIVGAAAATAAAESTEAETASEGVPASRMLHAFVFSFGCVVIWNCTVSDEQDFLQHVLPAVEKPRGGEIEEDDLTFVLGPGRNSTRIRNNRVILSSTHPIEMFAISLAFAQSVKLSVHEGEVDDVIQQSRAYPKQLAMTGKIPVTQTTVSKKIGQLFLLRYKIFLDSEMLDTPEYFWESDEYEPQYAKARKYLEMDKRMGLLNQRLDVVRELLDMLAQALENSHANRLEWIIMVLVAAEVFCQVFFSLVDTTCWSACGASSKGGSAGDL
jgi:uncharacterized Rmd1/YagE family protein